MERIVIFNINVIDVTKLVATMRNNTKSTTVNQSENCRVGLIICRQSTHLTRSLPLILYGVSVYMCSYRAWTIRIFHFKLCCIFFVMCVCVFIFIYLHDSLQFLCAQAKEKKTPAHTRRFAANKNQIRYEKFIARSQHGLIVTNNQPARY